MGGGRIFEGGVFLRDYGSSPVLLLLYCTLHPYPTVARNMIQWHSRKWTASQLTAQYHMHLNTGASRLYPMLQVVTQDKCPVDAGLYAHCHCQSYSMFTPAAHPFKSGVGINTSLFECYITSCTDHTYDTPLCRRTDEKTNSKLQVFPQWNPTGERTMQTRRSSTNDDVCSVPRL